MNVKTTVTNLVVGSEGFVGQPLWASIGFAL